MDGLSSVAEAIVGKEAPMPGFHPASAATMQNSEAPHSQAITAARTRTGSRPKNKTRLEVVGANQHHGQKDTIAALTPSTDSKKKFLDGTFPRQHLHDPFGGRLSETALVPLS
ncbi:hypothetical protein [Mesorhizobium comanense]|uniref:hypothetical protein n=1 Tax=Mesorhizobium comanense TaxID=2502215 RepID=UPI0010FA0CA5|nr:hypothetical protein [Mesorhizobium comanense]